MNPRIRRDFPVTSELTYLDTAYDGPYPLPVTQAGRDFLERRSLGIAGRMWHWVEVLNEVRVSIARLINATLSEIAITSNTTAGTNIVATSLDMEPGDNVVWDDLSFPSNAVVWLNLERCRGVESRVVNNRSGAVTVADFERVVDSRTKVISVSYVSHRNGFVHDVNGLADLAHAHGAYLHVDGIQAAGAIQVDVKSSGIDFLTSGAYKWLLGPMGLAFFYVKEELLPGLEPLFGGFFQVKTWADEAHLFPQELYESAKKFETATVHFQGLYELRAALEYINGIGMDRIQEQVLRLSAKTWSGLYDLGSTMLTPRRPRSGIVSCGVDDGEKIGRLLRDKRIVASINPGNELRISPHFFNTEEEIDYLLSVLESAR